jgi:SAM-dependent methyltransferase
MAEPLVVPQIDQETLRCEIRKEYATVATDPARSFHFNTGRPLARVLDYQDEWLAGIPEEVIASFAGTGNPFSLGPVQQGNRVVDVGSGAGFDSLIAARLVGVAGKVIGVDMTPEMLAKARRAAVATQVINVEFREGYAEALPVSNGWADVVISNGVVNLCPDKLAVFKEMFRVLRPGGRIQIGDIIVQKAVPDSAKADVDLWTG